MEGRKLVARIRSDMERSVRVNGLVLTIYTSTTRFLGLRSQDVDTPRRGGTVLAVALKSYLDFTLCHCGQRYIYDSFDLSRYLTLDAMPTRWSPIAA